MSNANHDDSKPLGFGSSAELGPVPAVPFCRVRDVANPSMCAMLGQDPDAPLFTAEQLRAEVAAERERWQTRVEQAFREGYWARETYNDSEVSDADEKWASAKAGLFRA